MTLASVLEPLDDETLDEINFWTGSCKYFPSRVLPSEPDKLFVDRAFLVCRSTLQLFIHERSQLWVTPHLLDGKERCWERCRPSRTSVLNSVQHNSYYGCHVFPEFSWEPFGIVYLFEYWLYCKSDDIRALDSCICGCQFHAAHVSFIRYWQNKAETWIYRPSVLLVRFETEKPLR